MGDRAVTNVREWVQTAREEKWGIAVDLAFAIIWVSLVELLFQVIDGPTYAYYMLMLAGIIAYFGLFWNLELAKEGQK